MQWALVPLGNIEQAFCVQIENITLIDNVSMCFKTDDTLRFGMCSNTSVHSIKSILFFYKEKELN